MGSVHGGKDGGDRRCSEFSFTTSTIPYLWTPDMVGRWEPVGEMSVVCDTGRGRVGVLVLGVQWELGCKFRCVQVVGW